MTTTLFITIDTEEDLWDDYNRWDNPVSNIKQIPMLQNIFDRYGAMPTYLINYPVTTNQNAISILLKILDTGRCDIGTHCHPWNTPPFEEEITPRNTMICNLSYDLQYRKIETLHSAIVNSTSLEPKCFRAGRWGFGPDTARSISQLGYKIDTSVSPFTDWTPIYGPDFSNAPTKPYRINYPTIPRTDNINPLLEIPATVGFLQKNMKLCGYLIRYLSSRPLRKLRFLGILKRMKLVNYTWLSPEQTDGEAMIRLAETFIKTGHSYLNMSFHSTSLMPGKTPFTTSKKDVERMLSNIEVFLKYAVEKNITFCPLSEAHKKFTCSL